MACDDAPKAAKQAMRLNSGELERRFKSHCFPQRNQQGRPEGGGGGGCHDVKEDFRLKPWLVAGGHVLPPPLESIYSGVISLPSIRLVCFIAELNGLDLCTVANRQFVQKLVLGAMDFEFGEECIHGMLFQTPSNCHCSIHS